MKSSRLFVPVLPRVHGNFHDRVYSKTRRASCAGSAQDFSGIRFHGTVLPQFAHAGCYEFITTCRDFKNRLPRAWQSHAEGSGGHQTDSKPAPVLAIGVNSIRGRLGHYRTGFRRPSQDRRHRHFRPASGKPIAQPGRNASPAKRKIHRPKK